MQGLSWTKLALADLRRIDSWLEQQTSPEFATRTLATIRLRANFLLNFPHGGRPVIPPEFRVLRVHDTPYLIIYRIVESGVQILRVQHEREDWQIEP